MLVSQNSLKPLGTRVRVPQSLCVPLRVICLGLLMTNLHPVGARCPNSARGERRFILARPRQARRPAVPCRGGRKSVCVANGSDGVSEADFLAGLEYGQPDGEGDYRSEVLVSIQKVDFFAWSTDQFGTEACRAEFWDTPEIQIGQALDAFAKEQAERVRDSSLFVARPPKTGSAARRKRSSSRRWARWSTLRPRSRDLRPLHAVAVNRLSIVPV